MKKIIVFFQLLILCLGGLLISGGCSSGAFPSDYLVGVIYSTEYKDKSKIDFYDSNLKKISNRTYSYGCMGHDGFVNANIVDGILYECPLGKATEKDLGLIIGLDVSSGKVVEYNFNRTNITDYICDENYIYTSSNLNGINYIDRYDRQNGNISTIEIEGQYVAELAVNEKTLYGFNVALDNGSETTEINLCKFNFDLANFELLHRLTDILEDSPSYSVITKQKLYFSEEKRLFIYDLIDNKIDTMNLVHENGFNLFLNDNLLYVGCSDIFGQEESWIDVVDLNSNEIVNTYSIDCPILQMDINENYIYVSDFEKINVYQFLQNTSIEKIDIVRIPEYNDYYVGGFFIKEKK